MLDKLSMVVMIILYIVFCIITIFMYLLVKFANENKTDYERRMEDEEQMKYLKEYKNRRTKEIWKK